MTQNFWSNSEDQGQSRRHNPPRLYTTPQSYGIQYKEVLVEERPGTMQKNGDPKNNLQFYRQLIFHSGSENILSLPQISFGFFCTMLWKNLKEPFGQPNIRG